MDFPLNPCAELPYCGRLGPLVFQDGGGVPVLREAFLQSAALVIRLLCSRLHNSRYVALVKMRLWTSKDAVFNMFPPLATT